MSRNMRNSFGLCGVLFCLYVAGCTVGPDYHPIATGMPESFAADKNSHSHAPDHSRAGQPVIEAAKWWKSLNDPELDKLVDQALAGNPDLEIALDRLQEARIQETIVLGRSLPEAGVSMGGGAGSGSDLARGRASSGLISGDSTGHTGKVTHVIGFDTFWELDLFGKYRREREAAKYDTEAAAKARNNVLITVIADMARAYIDLRAQQLQLAILDKNIETLENYVKLVQERYDRGITNELDLTLAERQLGSLKAGRPSLLARINASQYVIAVLMGKFPEEMPHELGTPGMIPNLPDQISAGLPVDLLRRRPDIQEAERRVAGSTARIGIAKADLFPHISLLGGIGIQGNGLGNNFDSGHLWSIGPSVNWSILDFGVLDNLIEKADLQAREALVQYKRTVLNAVREVDTALESYKAQEKRLTHLDTALAASHRAVDLATQRYDRGLTDSLNVIDAERQEYDLEAQYIAAQQNRAEQFVSLYKALGGGWELYQSIPAIQKKRSAAVASLAKYISADKPQNP